MVHSKIIGAAAWESVPPLSSQGHDVAAKLQLSGDFFDVKSSNFIYNKKYRR